MRWINGIRIAFFADYTLRRIGKIEKFNTELEWQQKEDTNCRMNFQHS